MSEKIFIQRDGEVIEANTQDLSYLESWRNEVSLQMQTQEAIRASAVAKLAALGLTEDEIAAL
jgi:hypothetical protein